MQIVKISAIWCPGCLVMKKVWKSILEKYNDLKIIELDYDMNSDEVSKYEPGTILPVIIFEDENGNELTRLIGEQKQETILNLIDKYR